MSSASLPIRTSEPENEARFRSFLDGAPDAIVIIDREGKIELVNRLVESTFGYSRAELVGQPAEILTPERFWPTFLARKTSYLRSPEAKQMGSGHELFGRRKDGTEFPADVSLSPVDMDGNVRIMASIRNISKKKKVESQLRFLVDASRAMAEAIDFQACLDRLVHLVVPELSDWCGVIIKECSGDLSLKSFAHRDPSKLPIGAAIMQGYVPDPVASRGLWYAIETGRAVLVPVINDEIWDEAGSNLALRASFEKIGFEAYIIVPLAAGGHSLGALILGQGESHRKFEQEDLPFYESLATRASVGLEKARLYWEAQNAVRTRDNILAIVSHDLKNPLLTVALSAEHLKVVPGIPSPAKEMVDKASFTMLQCVRLMERFIQDILDLSRLQAKSFPVQTKEDDLGLVVESCAEIMRPFSASKSQSLVIQIDPTLPRLSFDSLRVKQVLFNLISNGIKFTPPGGVVTVRVSSLEREARIAVSDTGPGVAANELPFIFERFWQAKENVLHGTGLGLWIAKGIVEAHHGKIWVESVAGKGSTFFFTLPY